MDFSRLDGIGISFTLTVGKIPDSHGEWERMRKAFMDRMRRLGMVRLHWLTEFQKRGAPHLHGIAYFPADYEHGAHGLKLGVIWHWIQVAEYLGTAERAQHAAEVTYLMGWKKYLGKHGSRSVEHYQRSGGTRPGGWEKTGRMWGTLGDWPLFEVELDATPETFYRSRRVVRSFLLAEARTDLRRSEALTDPEKRSRARSEALGRIQYLRHRMKVRSNKRITVAEKRQRSELRGFSDWGVQNVLARWLLMCGDVQPWSEREVNDPTPSPVLRRLERERNLASPAPS